MTLRSLVGICGVVAASAVAMAHFPTAPVSAYAAQPTRDTRPEAPAPTSNEPADKAKPEDGKKEDKGKSVPKRYKAPPPIHDFGEDEEEYAVA